jgi:methionyl-tRNA formyltransferase
MRIAVLTADEPLYLPAFFDRFLEARAKDVAGVFICRPVYKGQTTYSMVRRYARTFGLWNAVALTRRIIAARIKDTLRIGWKRRRFHSVASAARYHKVSVFTPEDVNAPAFIEQLASLGVDLILSVSCPQIFKDELISVPALGCLNLHGADLPAYRGIMPSFWMLANGEEQAGATIFYVNAGIDTGDVAGKRRFPIHPDDTLHTFIIRAKREACDLAIETLDAIEAGTVTTTPVEGQGSYFSFPTRQAYVQFRKRGRRMR